MQKTVVIFALYFLSKDIKVLFKLAKASQINIPSQDHYSSILSGKGNMMVLGILSKVTHEACTKTKLEMIFSVLLT